MSDKDQYEIIGRQVIELNRITNNYNSLLSVLNNVVNGSIDIDRVTVDVERGSVTIEPEEPKTENDCDCHSAEQRSVDQETKPTVY